MGILDRIFGNDEKEPQKPKEQQRTNNLNATNGLADEQAIARYRYMLKTAPPETIEQAHAEAFAQLTSRQRQMVLEQLAAELPESERRITAQSGNDPQTLARLATRAEIRQPGTIERVFGGWGGTSSFGGGVGLGGFMAGSFLSSLAGTVIGSYIAQQFFDNDLNHLAGNFDNAYQDFGAGNYQDTGAEDNYDALIQDDHAAESGFGTETSESEIDDFGGANQDFGDFSTGDDF